MSDVRISDDILYIGVDDGDLDLFESQYEVPNGVSYNSYLIIDDKIAVMEQKERWDSFPYIYILEFIFMKMGKKSALIRMKCFYF